MEFLPRWLNPFDILIIFALLIGTTMGLIRGLLRMSLGLLVIYIAAILAMNFYIPLGRWLRYLTGNRASVVVGEAIAFLLILAIVAIVLHVLLRRTFKDTEWPGIRQIDQLGGMTLGFILTALWIGLTLVGLAFVLGVPGVGSDAFRQNVLFYFQRSALIPIFYRFLPHAFATLKPWIPRGRLPEILTFRLF